MTLPILVTGPGAEAAAVVIRDATGREVVMIGEAVLNPPLRQALRGGTAIDFERPERFDVADLAIDIPDPIQRPPNRAARRKQARERRRDGTPGTG